MSRYAQRMARLSNRIFGEPVTPPDKGTRKVIKIFSGLPAHLDKEVTQYYPRHKELKNLMAVLRYHGLYR